MSILRKLFSILSIKEKNECIVVIIYVLVLGLFDILGIASIIPFLTVVSDESQIYTNKILIFLFTISNSIGVENTFKFKIVLGLISITLLIFSAVVRSYTMYKTTFFIELMRFKISKKLFSSYMSQDYLFFLNRNSSDLVKNVISEVDRIVAQLIRPVIFMLSYFIMSLLLVTFVIYISPIQVLYFVGIIGLIYFTIFVILKNKIKIIGEKAFESNKNRNFIINQSFGGIKYIKFKSYEDVYTKSFNKSAFNYSYSVALHHVLNQIPKYLVEVLVFISVIVYILLGLYSSPGSFNQTLPLIGAYALVAYRLQPCFVAIYQGLSSLKFGQTALIKISSDINHNPKIIKADDLPKIVLHNNLIIKNLYFRYNQYSDYVLKNINITLNAKACIGITGESGSGKSTLIDNILGILHPTTGRIMIDGVDLSEENVIGWQNSIGYVPQETYLFDTSIAHNISMEENDTDICVHRLEIATKFAQIYDYITSLSCGFETKVGERGVKFSGGQRQRIGIARALYNMPSLLILDEATSALDNKTQDNFIKSVKHLIGRFTIIIISHRLETLKHCDNIFHMVNKRLIKKL